MNLSGRKLFVNSPAFKNKIKKSFEKRIPISKIIKLYKTSYETVVKIEKELRKKYPDLPKRICKIDFGDRVLLNKVYNYIRQRKYYYEIASILGCSTVSITKIAKHLKKQGKEFPIHGRIWKSDVEKVYKNINKYRTLQEASRALKIPSWTINSIRKLGKRFGLSDIKSNWAINRTVSNEELKKIKLHRFNGYGCRRISKMTGINEQRVCYILRKLKNKGIQFPSRRPFKSGRKSKYSDELINSIYSDFKAGFSKTELEKKYGIKINKIINALGYKGFKLRFKQRDKQLKNKQLNKRQHYHSRVID